jgi:hypothetical protein
LLDRTHLRFFTLASIRELFSGAGLQIIDAQATSNATAQSEPLMREFLSLLTPVVKQLRLSPEGFAERSTTFQYLIRARRQAAETRHP